jgi:hypothetical protein
MQNEQELHSYYIANSGWLFGLLPNTCTVVKVGPRPNMVSFDPATRKLFYREGREGREDREEIKCVILPLNKAEMSKNPNLFEKTKTFLGSAAF